MLIMERVFHVLQVSDIFSNSAFRVFSDALNSGGIIKVICVPLAAKSYSNTALKKGDIYNEAIKSGAKGLPFLKVLDGSKLIVCLFLFIEFEGEVVLYYVFHYLMVSTLICRRT